jgi:hypothetical protein
MGAKLGVWYEGNTTDWAQKCLDIRTGRGRWTSIAEWRFKNLQNCFVVEWKKNKWTGHIARIWQMINAYQLKLVVRIRRRWQDNINMDLVKIKTEFEHRPLGGYFEQSVQHFSGFDSRQGYEFFFSPKGSHLLWSQPILRSPSWRQERRFEN